ncbi:MAG: penicillin-binding protein 2 [Frankiaceae bacterium]|jgi:peptidoglycan glycosyltransferase|nr:penicillin-binding protein 2 [Frankiaceae bacterium]
MNRALTRVAAFLGVLLIVLVANLTYVTVIKGPSYAANPANRRVLFHDYSRERGEIVVGGALIATSEPVDDQLKYQRIYSEGPLYAPVTGYDSLYYGTSGLERAENPVLSGDDDRLFANRVTDLLKGRDPRGGNILLTLSKAAQQAAFTALGNRRGAVVALDPKTGAILAAVSTPSYDPNALSSHDTDAIQQAYADYQNDPSSPMVNRALTQTYPPGSVFKVVVAAAGLAQGLAPDTQIPAPDSITLPDSTTTLANYGGERCGDGQTDTLAHALAISCNTAFAQLGMSIGTPALRAEAAAFGIDDQPFTMPLYVARSTIGPVPDQGALAQSSIGQRDVQITPLQGAMIAATVANGGTLMAPYLVAQQQAPNLATLPGGAAKPAARSTAMTADQAAALTQMMVGVVDGGTGTAAQIPGVPVAGKTGTADIAAGEPPHAWFIGFAPANDPKIAVAVLIENGGVSGSETTGGLAAAPVAADVIKAYLGL